MNNEIPVLEKNIHAYKQIEKLYKIIFIIYNENLIQLKNNYGSDMIPIKVNSNLILEQNIIFNNNYINGHSDEMPDIYLNYKSKDSGQI